MELRKDQVVIYEFNKIFQLLTVLTTQRQGALRMIMSNCHQLFAQISVIAVPTWDTWGCIHLYLLQMGLFMLGPATDTPNRRRRLSTGYIYKTILVADACKSKPDEIKQNFIE